MIIFDVLRLPTCNNIWIKEELKKSRNGWRNFIVLEQIPEKCKQGEGDITARETSIKPDEQTNKQTTPRAIFIMIFCLLFLYHKISTENANKNDDGKSEANVLRSSLVEWDEKKLNLNERKFIVEGENDEEAFLSCKWNYSSRIR